MCEKLKCSMIKVWESKIATVTAAAACAMASPVLNNNSKKIGNTKSQHHRGQPLSYKNKYASKWRKLTIASKITNNTAVNNKQSRKVKNKNKKNKIQTGQSTPAAGTTCTQVTQDTQCTDSKTRTEPAGAAVNCKVKKEHENELITLLASINECVYVSSCDDDDSDDDDDDEINESFDVKKRKDYFELRLNALIDILKMNDTSKFKTDFMNQFIFKKCMLFLGISNCKTGASEDIYAIVFQKCMDKDCKQTGYLQLGKRVHSVNSCSETNVDASITHVLVKQAVLEVFGSQDEKELGLIRKDKFIQFMTEQLQDICIRTSQVPLWRYVEEDKDEEAALLSDIKQFLPLLSLSEQSMYFRQCYQNSPAVATPVLTPMTPITPVTPLELRFSVSNICNTMRKKSEHMNGRHTMSRDSTPVIHGTPFSKLNMNLLISRLQSGRGHGMTCMTPVSPCK